MQIVDIKHTARGNALVAIKEGIVYSFNHPVVGVLLLFAGIASIFGWSFTAMLPYMAEQTFHLGAWGLGMLYAASGIGAFCATVFVSVYSKKIRGISFIFAGVVLFALGAVLFSFTTKLSFALVYLFLAGLGLLVIFSMLNITIQTIIEDRYRGRVMSIYAVMFLGLSSLGSYQIGFFSEQFGTDVAIRMGAGITLISGVLLFLSRKKIRAAYKNYSFAER
jgi:MFS family permease